MDVFSFDQQFFFHRQPPDTCWYAYRHPSLNLTAPESFAHGYFDIAGGRFVRTPEDGRGFSPQEILEIEGILSEHADEMDLEQFNIHRQLPAHYREVRAGTNRYSNLQSRSRQIGVFDPEFSVAFDQLTTEEPAYRLTRDFVLRVLERASTVSAEDRDSWLCEVLEDLWIYDTSPYAEAGETFESFYDETVRGLLVPEPAEQRENTEYRLYEIDQLPRIYLFAEETRLPEYDTTMKKSRHFLDRESAIVPIPLPGYGGQACYIS